ncbi:MAG: hypothetical protein WDA21_00725 [Bacilli bacterium]
MSKINVADFDGVIRTGYLIIDLYSFCCLKQPSLLRYSLNPGVGIARHFFDYNYLERSRINYFRFYSKMTDKKYLIDFMDNHFDKKITNYYKDNIPKDTYVVSFNPNPLMQLVGEYLGNDPDKYIGSNITIDEETGKLKYPLCYGKNKLNYLLKKFSDLKEIENFYTDTPWVDKKIIAISKNAYYVKGDKMQIPIKLDGKVLDEPVIFSKR